MQNLDTDRQENHLHVLTDEDVENLLIQIDSVYWHFLNLTKKRAIKINYDPHALSRELNKE